MEMMTDTPSIPSALAAAIDIGSNGIRLRICSLDSHGQIEVIHHQRASIRLGADAFSFSQTISEQNITNAEHVFQDFRRLIDLHHVKSIRAVATSALRGSKNASAFISRIQKVSDIHIEIISGVEEGRLIHAAIHHKIPDMGVGTGTALFIDIGGGSVEVSISEGNDITSIRSYKAGTVRLLNRFGKIQSPNDLSLLKEYLQTLQQQIKKQIAGKHIDVCVGTGGNIECLGQLNVSLFKNEADNALTYTNIKALSESLNALSYTERSQELKLKPDRADVIIPASLILKYLLQLVPSACLKIPQVGLVDGMMIDLLSDNQLSQATQTSQALAWATTLAHKFHVNTTHASYVADLAENIFKQLAPTYQLTPRDLLLLKIAATLHEIGMVIRIEGHHRHARYIISASPMIGLTEDESEMVASMIRYHR
ncbi:MAG: Ppx/GppA phosphatase family protein, partial [Ghiorsea sp.]